MRILIPIIIFFLFISCNKDKVDTTVKGRVMNDITGQPMENFQINIMERKKKTLEGEISTLITTAYSNSNGDFEARINSKCRGKFSYEIVPIFDNQMYIDSYTSYYLQDDNISKKDENYFDIKIAPAGKLTTVLSPPPPHMELMIRYMLSFTTV